MGILGNRRSEGTGTPPTACTGGTLHCRLPAASAVISLSPSSPCRPLTADEIIAQCTSDPSDEAPALPTSCHAAPLLQRGFAAAGDPASERCQLPKHSVKDCLHTLAGEVRSGCLSWSPNPSAASDLCGGWLAARQIAAIRRQAGLQSPRHAGPCRPCWACKER